jgi:deazaflavin-dependent oxidoreductase (nitroreductase family)
MELGRGVATFNRLINNRIQGLYAWLIPPWAVLLHKGRTSGRAYRTPVLAFRQGDTLVIALLYGERSQWLRNLTAAGGGRFVRGGHTYELGPPRTVATEEAGELERLSPLSRRYCRLADHQVLAQIGARVGGFGRGHSDG